MFLTKDRGKAVCSQGKSLVLERLIKDGKWKKKLFGMRCNIGTLNTLKSLLATLCSSMYMEGCWIWHGKEIEKD